MKYRSLRKHPYMQPVVNHLSSHVALPKDCCGDYKIFREIDSRKVMDTYLILESSLC